MTPETIARIHGRDFMQDFIVSEVGMGHLTDVGL